jgi:hypothetical protein
MSKSNSFSIFDMHISKPFEIEEVLKVLEKQMQHKNKLERELNYSEEQAFEEIVKIYEVFFSSMSEEDKELFETLHKQAISLSIQRNGVNGLESEWQISKLYDINVTYPFNRKNVREIISKEKKIIEELINSGLTLEQAELDIQDLIVDFYTRIGTDKANDFSKLYTDEKIAEIQHQSKVDQERIRVETEDQIKAITNYSVIYSIVGIALVLIIFFALVSK